MKSITQYNHFLIVLFLIVLLFNFAFANGNSDQLTPIVQCKTADECNWEEFVTTTGRFISYIVVISYWIAFLLVVVGSFLVMFHGPKVELYKRGVDIIKIAIFGYILILLSGVIFDVILEFFEPKFEKEKKSEGYFYLTFSGIFLPKVYADDYESSTFTLWYITSKSKISSSLKCGENASTTLDRLFKCAFEATNSLKSLALILLGLAVIASAAYIISVPLFGLKNISRAYQILIWSIIGLIIILLSEIIKSQIEILTKTE